MNSYDTVNYKILPQKQIERGLISQLVNTFSNFIGKRINYIGMGSLYFADFVFFNKNCTINKMISIEKMMDNGEYNIQKEKRFNLACRLLAGLSFVNRQGQPLRMMKKLELDPALLEQPLYH